MRSIVLVERQIVLPAESVGTRRLRQFTLTNIKQYKMIDKNVILLGDKRNENQ
jgi:hypothetical protein